MSAPSRIDPRLHTMLERLRNASFTRGARVIAFTAPASRCGHLAGGGDVRAAPA